MVKGMQSDEWLEEDGYKKYPVNMTWQLSRLTLLTRSSDSNVSQILVSAFPAFLNLTFTFALLFWVTVRCRHQENEFMKIRMQEKCLIELTALSKPLGWLREGGADAFFLRNTATYTIYTIFCACSQKFGYSHFIQAQYPKRICLSPKVFNGEVLGWVET